MSQEPLPPEVLKRLPLAWAAIAWERFVPAAWPLIGVAMLFLAVGLSDALPLLPLWLHALVLGGFAGGFIAALFLFWRRFALPERAALLRRLERASGFADQPLTQLDDRFAGAADDALGQAVWRESQRRIASGLGTVRVGGAHGNWVGHDPLALRAALLLLLIVGGIYAGRDAGHYLTDSVRLRFPPRVAAASPSLDLWITPPAYTGLAPVYFDHPGTVDKPVQVPAGSSVLAQIHTPDSGGDTPELDTGGHATAFAAESDRDFKAGAVLAQSGPLVVSLGGQELARVPVEIVPDLPPKVELRRPIGVTEHQALRIDYAASDDYGVASLRLEVWRVDDHGGGALPGAPKATEIAVPAPPAREIADVLFTDMTADLWAGLPVEMRLVAKDAAGQQGYGPITRMVLPERQFHNEAARLIAALRKRLTTAPEQAPQVAQVLAELSGRPDLYRNKASVFLALRVAARELIQPGGPETITDAQGLMWSTALDIEGGQAAAAEAALRQAQNELRDALARGATGTELDRLMRQMEQAMNRYLQALNQSGVPQQQNQMAGTGQTRSVTEDQLKNMMRQAEEMARSGDRQGAQDMLRQLQSILESLRTGSNSAMAQAQKSLDALGQLARRQQGLMDRSQRLQQGADTGATGAPPGEQAGSQPGEGEGEGPPDSSSAVGQAQQALRQQLDALKHGMGSFGQGEGGQALDAAGRAMDRAARSLKRGEPGPASGEQGEALSAMQQAAQAMQHAMQQQGGQANGQTDPFGRSSTGRSASDQGDMDLSNPTDRQESRRILDELRRRAGEVDRPPLEHDYIDRLLRDF